MAGADPAAIAELREMMAARAAAVAAKSPHRTPTPASRPEPVVERLPAPAKRPWTPGGFREVAPGPRPSEARAQGRPTCGHTGSMSFSAEECSCSRCGALWQMQMRQTAEGDRMPVRWVCTRRGRLGREER